MREFYGIIYLYILIMSTCSRYYFHRNVNLSSLCLALSLCAKMRRPLGGVMYAEKYRNEKGESRKILDFLDWYCIMFLCSSHQSKLGLFYCFSPQTFHGGLVALCKSSSRWGFSLISSSDAWKIC